MWLGLIRVFNIPIPLAGMLVGAYSASEQLDEYAPLLVLAALLGCAATQCFNDYEDREVDALNASFRPIPSGGLEAERVIVVGHLLTLGWFVLSLCCERQAALIVVLVYLLTRWYSIAKRRTLAHHLLLPAALGLMPIYGSVMVSATVTELSLYAGLSIFLIDVNMNIVGAFKDLWEGSAHERVLPSVWAPRPAVWFALVCALVGIAVQVAAVHAGLCGPTPLVPLGLGALLTVRSRASLIRKPSAQVGYAALKSGRLTECLTFPALLAGLLPLTQAAWLIGALTFFALLGQSLIPEAELPPEADQELA